MIGLKKLITSAMIACAATMACPSKVETPMPIPIHFNLEEEVIDAFDPSKVEEMQKELEGKKLALALITTYDHNRTFKKEEQLLKNDFSDLQDYKVYTARVNDLREFLNNLRDYGKVKKIDALILAFHGNPKGMTLSRSEDISEEKVSRYFKDYKRVFSDDAVTLFYSCSTGRDVEEGKNISQDISDTLNIDIMAPKYALDNEGNIPPDIRKGAFVPDENGRIIFETDNYVIGIDKREGELAEEFIIVKSRALLHPDIFINTRDADNAFLYIDK